MIAELFDISSWLDASVLVCPVSFRTVFSPTVHRDHRKTLNMGKTFLTNQQTFV